MIFLFFTLYFNFFFFFFFPFIIVLIPSLFLFFLQSSFLLLSSPSCRFSSLSIPFYISSSYLLTLTFHVFTFSSRLRFLSTLDSFCNAFHSYSFFLQFSILPTLILFHPISSSPFPTSFLGNYLSAPSYDTAFSPPRPIFCTIDPFSHLLL